MTRSQVADLSAASLRPVGMILLAVGAGAFHGAVLKATGIGDVIAESLHGAGLPAIFAAYVISCGLRVAQGSATAAIAATAAIVGPTTKDVGYAQPQLALIAAAIRAGSIIASHVDDGGFWIVSRYFGISVKDTLKTWTVLETILSVVAFAVAALLMAVIGRLYCRLGMNDDDELWVDSADRKVALRALAEHQDSENLTSAEHDRRRDLVREARTRADLRALFADLPSPHPLMGEERDGWEATPRSSPDAATPEGRSNGTGLVLGSGAVIVLGALVAGWWVPAIILAFLVVVVTVLVAAR